MVPQAAHQMVTGQPVVPASMGVTCAHFGQAIFGLHTSTVARKASAASTKPAMKKPGTSTKCISGTSTETPASAQHAIKRSAARRARTPTLRCFSSSVAFTGSRVESRICSMTSTVSFMA